MTIKSSGKLSLSDIKSEFDSASGKTPLSRFYRGGSKVPNVTANNKISSSGKISLSMFYGATLYIPGSSAISAAGNSTFVVPAGVTQLTVTLVGAGGGGGGGVGRPDGNSNSQWAGGGGGGGGGEVLTRVVSVTPGQTFNLVIGSGGLGGAGATSGWSGN